MVPEVVTSESGGLKPMQMDPSKPNAVPRRRSESLKFLDQSSRPSVLSVKTYLAQTPEKNSTQASTHAHKEAADVVLGALFSDVNQELAGLLRDVRRETAPEVQRSRDPQQVGELLMRAVRVAAKQYVLQEELKELALKDELTGFYNRRGFQVLAERQLKLAMRSGRGMLLFFVDVDGLKKINDSFGHGEGDRVLTRTAEMLKKTFRDSDVIARMGGDEFAVLAVEASDHSEARIRARLQKYLNANNSGETRPSLSLSVGVARFDQGNPTTLKDLMAQADQSMYEQKRSRLNS